MRTVLLLAGARHPVLDRLHAHLREGFRNAPGYRLVEPEEAPADVTLAFLDDPAEAAGLGIERRSYQDFIGLLYPGRPGSTAGEKVLRAYEVGLTVMANLAVDLETAGDGSGDVELTLITPERGVEVIRGGADMGQELLETLIRRSDVTYLDDNVVHADLPESLAAGTERTRAMQRVARQLDRLDLVPPAVPLDELSDRARRRYFKVLGLRQISYGNMSARHEGDSFWMTGRGVDKANLEVIGRDIVLVDRFDRDERRLHLRVPPGYGDARASIDSAIHATIYEAYPGVGAMIHIHVDVDGVVYTDNHYPCGTVELCDSILAGLGRTADPERTILGLTNHGILVTGASVDDAWQQIRARHEAMEPAGAA